MTSPANSWLPWSVLDIDVASGIPEIGRHRPDGSLVGGAWILVRAFDEPLGVLEIAFSDADLSPTDVRAAFPLDLEREIRRRLADAAFDPHAEIALDGYTTDRQPAFLTDRDQVIADGPEVTAVICTRNQPAGLARCLTSLQRQSYPRLRIMVVDNASTSEESRVVTEESQGPFPVTYVFEANPGLSNARNRSMAEAVTDLLAWIDDDEVADPHWVAELVRGYRQSPSASSVCGVMLPGELETVAQAWFEEYGGHSKGRGFHPAEFSPATSSQQSPLFPLPPFGTGGNMSMTRQAVERFGGFDPALGAGAPTMGSEDTKALSQILLDGGVVRYQPTALTWHFHRRESAAFERQLYGYGKGLSAFYTSLIVDRPKLLVPLLRLAPHALRELRDPEGARLGGIGPAFPSEVLRAHRRGMLEGPLSYLRARRKTRSAVSPTAR